MDFVETTITEHVYNQGWIKGEAEGKIEGETEGRKKTAINLLKMGIDMEIIQKATGLSDAEIKQITSP